MSEIFDSYIGFVDESVYGTPVAVTRFYEFIKESISGDYQRIESQGIRAGARLLREDRWVPNPKGAAGSAELEVLDQSFGLMLKHILGAVATAGPTLAVYTHTFTVGTLRGKSFTTQVARVDVGGTQDIFTYGGGKVKSWELSNSGDQLLMLKLDLDYQAETIGAGAGPLAAQSPTWPSYAYPTGTAGARLLSFVGGEAKIAGTQFSVTDISIKGDQGLKDDRYYARNSALKKEPLEEKMRNYTFEIKGDFEDVTQINRVASATLAGASAALQFNWVGPQTTVGGGQPKLTIDIPVARFDSSTINVENNKLVVQDIKGQILTPVAGTSPITITYVTPDALP